MLCIWRRKERSSATYPASNVHFSIVAISSRSHCNLALGVVGAAPLTIMNVIKCGIYLRAATILLRSLSMRREFGAATKQGAVSIWVRFTVVTIKSCAYLLKSQPGLFQLGKVAQWNRRTHGQLKTLRMPMNKLMGPRLRQRKLYTAVHIKWTRLHS